MKKKDLEKAQADFRGNTQLSTETLRGRVASDLNVVKDAYDVGSIALTEIEKRISLLGAGGESPSEQVRDLSHLVRAYADISKSLIALRGEGRTTIREATAAHAPSAQAAAPGLTPPGPDEPSDGAVHTHPAKISSPRATPPAGEPSTIGQYLQAHIGDSDDEDR